MNQVVYVVDDDAAVRESICSLVETLVPASVEGYESGESFLASSTICEIACLILDQRMPGFSGIEVLEELQIRGVELPTILISGHSDSLPSTEELPTNVLAFLGKPYRGKELVALVRKGLAMNGCPSHRNT